MPNTQLCIAVTGATVEEMRRARDAAGAADLVELRLDTMVRPDPAAVLEGRTRPVIVTCRAEWEGGYFKGSEEERRRILESALALGAEFVDVEAAAGFADELIRSRNGRGIVLSHHQFDGGIGEVAGRYASMRGRGPEVVKIAAHLTRVSELVTLFDVAAAAPADDGGHVLVGMGPAGVPSRILGARLRNRWVYAGDGVAPGQIPLARVVDTYRFRRIRQDAALYAVVGNPVLHSLSPTMHNAGFAELALNAAYVPVEAYDAEDFVQFARGVSLRGASITAPFKIALLPFMDHVDPVARRIGAINTLVVKDGRWIGANTDVDGFLAPLAARIRLKGIRATVLGAGGAARAVAVGLADQGAAVTISARRVDAARAVADLVGGQVGEFPPRAGSWDVLVNTTTAGSTADPRNPIAGAELNGEIVFDLVYVPAETQLLADARAAGCLAIGGIEMLIAQAERQFELWTGMRPPAGLFAREVAPETRDVVNRS
jgi:3-dehydroquinate dehydratase/shikimate dehydrogenase